MKKSSPRKNKCWDMLVKARKKLKEAREANKWLYQKLEEAKSEKESMHTYLLCKICDSIAEPDKKKRK